MAQERHRQAGESHPRAGPEHLGPARCLFNIGSRIGRIHSIQRPLWSKIFFEKGCKISAQRINNNEARKFQGSARTELAKMGRISPRRSALSKRRLVRDGNPVHHWGGGGGGVTEERRIVREDARARSMRTSYVPRSRWQTSTLIAPDFKPQRRQGHKSKI